MQSELLRDTDTFFSDLSSKLQKQIPSEITSSFERNVSLHDCVKDNLKKFKEGGIKFGATLLNTSKIQNIIESSLSSQSQTVQALEVFEKQIIDYCNRVIVSQLPPTKIVSLQLPDEFCSDNPAEISVLNRQQLTPKANQMTRFSSLTGIRSLLSPNNLPKKIVESSVEKLRCNRASFLSKRNFEKPNCLLDDRKGNLRRLDSSFNRCENINTSNIKNDFEMEGETHLKYLQNMSAESPRELPRKQSGFNFCIRETQEENLLQNSSVNTLKLDLENLESNVHHFSTVDRNVKMAVRPETPSLRNSRGLALIGKSPIRATQGLLKKNGSPDCLKVEFLDKENRSCLKPRFELNLDSLKTEIVSKDRSRASSNNLSNLNINLDDLNEKPTNRVCELLKSKNIVKPPYVDLSSSSCLNSVD